MPRFIKKFINMGFCFALIGNTFFLPQAIGAQGFNELNLNVSLSGPSTTILKGIKLDFDNPMRFNFLVDQGENALSNEALKAESAKLIKFFLAALAIPEQDLWVNLSPYEKDRIIPEVFGQTLMGRDLLAQDFILKKITASLMHPDDPIGQQFWKRIYSLVKEKYGNTKIPVNTFNKVWIVPDKAVVYENGRSAFVLESHLKVMMEDDYLAQRRNSNKAQLRSNHDQKVVPVTTFKEVILPSIEDEVNHGADFVPLRQIFSSLILATWYKKKIKDSIINHAYSNQNKIKGVERENLSPEEIYQQYLQTFKKGVVNLIKEEQDPVTKTLVVHKYFTGGVMAMHLNSKVVYKDRAQLSFSDINSLRKSKLVDVVSDMAMNVAQDETLESFKSEMEEGLRKGVFKNTILALGETDSRNHITWTGNGFLLGFNYDYHVIVTASHLFTPDSGIFYSSGNEMLSVNLDGNDRVEAKPCPSLNSKHPEGKWDIAFAVFKSTEREVTPFSLDFKHIEGEIAVFVSQNNKRVSGGRLYESQIPGFEEYLIIKGAEGFEADSGSPVFVKRNGKNVIIGLYGGVLSNRIGDNFYYVIPFRQEVIKNILKSFDQHTSHQSRFKISGKIEPQEQEIVHEIISKYSYRIPPLIDLENPQSMKLGEWDYGANIMLGIEQHDNFNVPMHLEVLNVDSLPTYLNISRMREVMNKLLRLRSTGALSKQALEYLTDISHHAFTPELQAEITTYLRKFSFIDLSKLRINGKFIYLLGGPNEKFQSRHELPVPMLDHFIWQLAGLTDQEMSELADVYPARFGSGVEGVGKLFIGDDYKKNLQRFVDVMNTDLDKRALFERVLDMFFKVAYYDKLYRGAIPLEVNAGAGDDHEYLKMIPVLLFTQREFFDLSFLSSNIFLKLKAINDITTLSWKLSPVYLEGSTRSAGEIVSEIEEFIFSEFREKPVITQWHVNLIYRMLSASKSQGIRKADEIWNAFRDLLIKKELINYHALSTNDLISSYQIIPQRINSNDNAMAISRRSFLILQGGIQSRLNTIKNIEEMFTQSIVDFDKIDFNPRERQMIGSALHNLLLRLNNWKVVDSIPDYLFYDGQGFYLKKLTKEIIVQKSEQLFALLKEIEADVNWSKQDHIDSLAKPEANAHIPDFSYVVVDEKDNVVGFSVVNTLFNNKNICYLKDFVVSGKYPGSPFASWLLLKSFTEARKEGKFAAKWRTTRVGSEAAVKFYTKIGAVLDTSKYQEGIMPADNSRVKPKEHLAFVLQFGTLDNLRILFEEKTRNISNSAMQSVQAKQGGINLNPAQMSLQIKGQVDQSMISVNGEEINPDRILGITFKIKQMTPIYNILDLLEINN